jgi:aminoglycoside/choline kinase family phosphotransferase
VTALNSESTDSREAQRQSFLAAHGYGAARRAPMSGDASTRAYDRLHLADGSTRVFMDQPPGLESTVAPPDATPDQRRALGYNALARLAAGRVDAFAAVSGYLRSRGLSAPAVEALDSEHGFAILEDLGDDLFARLIEQGQDPLPLYEAATDLQVALHAEPPPAILTAPGASWPLSTYDDLALRTYTELFLEWWPKYAGLRTFPAEAAAEWETLAAPIRARGEAGAVVFAHRDFHAENLLWLPNRSGLARVGLLDFQDAVRAHPAWDLLHLLQDARRDVAPELETAMLERYLTARPGIDRHAFLADYRALATLNAARILGPIFARQVVAFGKRRYIDFMPRTWRYLERNLEHPDLDGLKAWFDRWIPEDTRPR